MYCGYFLNFFFFISICKLYNSQITPLPNLKTFDNCKIYALQDSNN